MCRSKYRSSELGDDWGKEMTVHVLVEAMVPTDSAHILSFKPIFSPIPFLGVVGDGVKGVLSLVGMLGPIKGKWGHDKCEVEREEVDGLAESVDVEDGVSDRESSVR